MKLRQGPQGVPSPVYTLFKLTGKLEMQASSSQLWVDRTHRKLFRAASQAPFFLPRTLWWKRVSGLFYTNECLLECCFVLLSLP